MKPRIKVLTFASTTSRDRLRFAAMVSAGRPEASILTYRPRAMARSAAGQSSLP
jgi:hypothetical protein